MGKIALYRDYRSRDFNELVGQKLVASTLEHAVKNQSVSHAYLFTGPRGVGKTSAARILARRVNEIEDTGEHPDIIEIDAASNNGVEEIRELREKVHVSPNFCKYKVYIIDEVHMLSNAAFNALLKTLEEPPQHAIFVLATTEPHKLPQTIISRTQHFPFRPISKAETVSHLASIAKKEKIKADTDALELLAELGEGSMRDSISLLDQANSAGVSAITVKHIQSLLGLAPSKQIDKLLEALTKSDIANTVEVYDQLLSEGVPPQLLLKQLLLHTQRKLRASIEKSDDIGSLRYIMKVLSRVPGMIAHSEFALEAALLEIASGPGQIEQSQSSEAKSFHSRIKRASQTLDTTQKKSKKESRESTPKSTEGKNTDSKSTKSKHKTKVDNNSWIKALSIIKKQHSTLFGLLRNTEANLEDGICEIEARFVFHHRRLSELSNKKAIAEALREATGDDIEIVLKPMQTKQSNTKKDEASKEEDVDAIAQVTQILGGEVANG